MQACDPSVNRFAALISDDEGDDDDDDDDSDDDNSGGATAASTQQGQQQQQPQQGQRLQREMRRLAGHYNNPVNNGNANGGVLGQKARRATKLVQFAVASNTAAPTMTKEDTLLYKDPAND